MRYSKKKLFFVVLTAVVCVVAIMGAWRFVPASETEMRGSVAIVDQTSWNEISVNGKPLIYFSDAIGDTALLGVTANRDSAVHHKRVAGCWIDRWAIIPSCGGRIATVYNPTPKAPSLKTDSDIIRLCRQSVATQLKTLKAQKNELDYYLRVHGVQDNGYQTIASLAMRVNAACGDVEKAGKIIDSVANAKRQRLAVKAMTRYTAICRESNGKTTHVALNVVYANPKRRSLLLQTTDRHTPKEAKPITLLPWDPKAERTILAVGFPGLGEQGLECDTVSPIIVPGHKFKGGRHDLPRILASDGSPVFTAKGRFIGIVSGNRIISGIKGK